MVRFRDRSSIAASAGDSVSALKAEIITEMAMVIANCLFRRPWMPPMNPTGMNTDARISAMLTTGPDTSCMAWSVASFGDNPSLDMLFHRLDHHDRIVDHQADGEDEAEEGERVDREAEGGKEDEGADQRDRDRRHRDERGAPVLQEQVDDEDHEEQRFAERDQDFPYPFRHGERRVDRIPVLHVRGKPAAPGPPSSV